MRGPSARLSVHRRGRGRDQDAIVVTTVPDDTVRSHQAAYDAIRRARIRPSLVRAGEIRMTFDPGEISQAQASELVAQALCASGVRVFRP